MQKKTGFIRYQKIMADFASEHLTPVVEARKKGNVLERPNDAAFSTIFQGFIEISVTLDAMHLSGKLIGLAPPRAKSIKKDEYIKFLVGAYLQEIYILEQRLSAYAKKISRLYKITTLPALVQKLVYLPLEQIISARGAHVHSQRYSDEKLDRLSRTALFESVGHELGEDLWFDYKLAQLEWTGRVKRNRESISKIVDCYFDLLHKVVCANGSVSWP